MDISSPQYIEKPVRLVDVMFANGLRDSVTLEPTDQLTDYGDRIEIVTARERITYTRAHLAAVRIMDTTIKVLVGPLTSPPLVLVGGPALGGPHGSPVGTPLAPPLSA